MGISFTVLGSVGIHRDAGPEGVLTPYQQALVAMLLLHANRALPTERICAAIWDDRPASWRANLRNHVTVVRRLAGEDRVVRRPGGYLLVVRAGESDFDEYRRLRAQGHAEIAVGDLVSGVTHLERALALWQGGPAGGIPVSSTLAVHLHAIEQDRLHAFETLVDARHQLGDHGGVLGTLQSVLAEHPTREGLWWRYMRAAYLAGDAGSALIAFERARSALAQQLGLDPGNQLRSVQRAILRRDDLALLSA